MMPVRAWQWGVLILPWVTIAGGLLLAAGWQIHTWGINWVWGIITLLLLGWRWLLVRWTQPPLTGEALAATLKLDTPEPLAEDERSERVRAILHEVLTTAQGDPPLWEDWTSFWQRCQTLVQGIAAVYHPQEEHPWLNITLPQAYGLIRGTVDDCDRWIAELSPMIARLTVAQTYRGYQVYRRIEPTAKWAIGLLRRLQWFTNPAAAAARQLSKSSQEQATQQLLGNLGHLLRETALRNLAIQAAKLYGGQTQIVLEPLPPPTPTPATQESLLAIIEQREPIAQITNKPLELLLVGRTGAGKSSVINTLFGQAKTAVDLLPSTQTLQSYQWQLDDGEQLHLWDTPGYEQVNRGDLQTQMRDYCRQADLILLVTPALDPALQMDLDFLQTLEKEGSQRPTVVLVTQVDRLRPLREWAPPYAWRSGDKPKEQAIREAIAYRAELFAPWCNTVLPLVNNAPGRPAWGVGELGRQLVHLLDPVKEARLARFLQDRETQIAAAGRIIERYCRQITGQQGMTKMLKSPVLQFLSTWTTGSTDLATLLAAPLPAEQVPVVVGKLQMAYELHQLLKPGQGFDPTPLWVILPQQNPNPQQDAWAFGHTAIALACNLITPAQVPERFQSDLQAYPNGNMGQTQK